MLLFIGWRTHVRSRACATPPRLVPRHLTFWASLACLGPHHALFWWFEGELYTSPPRGSIVRSYCAVCGCGSPELCVLVQCGLLWSRVSGASRVARWACVAMVRTTGRRRCPRLRGGGACGPSVRHMRRDDGSGGGSGEQPLPSHLPLIPLSHPSRTPLIRDHPPSLSLSNQAGIGVCERQPLPGISQRRSSRD